MKSASQRRALVAAFLAAALAGCSHNCFNRGEGCSSSSATAVTDTSTTAGQVVDGYVANATITLDVNDNRLCGDTVNGVVDISVQADAQGNFTFPAGTGSHMICATGGTDLSTGLPLVGRLLAPPGATEITPLTSLVMAQLNISQPSGKLTAATVSSAQTSLATSLGLGSINLLTADPVALANATPANPALLQTTAAIQAMLVQTASTLQAIGGNGTAVQGSANTNYLYSDAVKGVVSAIKSLPAGTTLSATGSGASSLGSLALVAVTNTATLAQKDTRLSGVSLGSMSPSSIAAFVAPSLTAMTNIVGSATASTLLTAGSNNPAANVQANVTVANTAALLAPTILTAAAAGNATLVADLATIAADALPVPDATGVVSPPADADAALLGAINAIPGLNTSGLPSATTLAGASGLDNVTNVVETDVNCDFSNGVPAVSCGTPANMTFHASNPLNQATATIHGNWNNVVLRLANPTGVALGDPATSPGATLSGRLRITVLPTNTADQRYLNLDVPVTGVQMTDAGGTHIVAAVAGSVVVSGITRTGTVETAVISQAESARIILLPQTGNAIGLNLQELVSALGGNPALSAGSFSTLFSLNGGSAGQNTSGVGQSFTITVSTSSADSANAPLNFLHLTTFPNPAPAVTNTFIMTATFARGGPFVYVTNAGDNTVLAYSINAATGALTWLGSPVGAGANPESVVISPNGQFAYVANYGDDTVSAYSINASTGALTALGSPVATGTKPKSVVISPNGQFAYVANYGDNTVSAYSINASTGALTALGSPVGAGFKPESVVISPNGQFAYVANYGDGNVSAYSINASTGALTAVKGSPIPAGPQPQGVVVSPNGQFAYVTNNGDGTVSAYTVNASTGALKAVKGSPFTAGHQPQGVVVSPNGQFAYVVNSGLGENISAYSINASTGALTAVKGSPFPAGTQPQGVVVSPNGQFAYVVNSGFGDNISAYSINASTGALTTLPGSPFKTGTKPFSIAISP